MSNLPKTTEKQNEVAPFSFFNQNQFETMQRVAGMFASSELVPDMYKITPENPKEKAIANCIIAIDIANRIGANILMVMQNLVIIYGRPSWSSKFLIATINTCGRFEPLKFRFTKIGELKNYQYTEYETEWVAAANGGKRKSTKLVEKTLAGPIVNWECIAYTSEKGSESVLESSPITIEMAINEGWYTKKGSKWSSMTQQMLMYRAASFWTSTYAPELSMGMKTTDELQDIVDIEFTEVPRNRENKTEIIQQPEPEPQPESQPEPQPQPQTSSQGTLKLEDL